MPSYSLLTTRDSLLRYIEIVIPFRPSRRILVCGLLLSLLASGCGRGRGKSQEIVYVSAPQVILRDRVAAVYSKTGVVKNGDRLQVLERDRRFVHVRTAEGTDGWVEQRNLITQQTYDGFQKLVKDNQNTPVQGTATTRNDTNLHITPGRDTDHLYVLSSGAKIAVFKRSTAPKTVQAAPAKPNSAESADNQPPAPVFEDWWLVRDTDGHVGWMLGRMMDLEVPLEIAQYAEGQRLVAFFVLNEVADGDKKVPEYLTLLTDPKDGAPYDFNQARVYTWNVRKHRYETAYRERNLNGFLPVTISHENFDKEGSLPVFVVQVKDDAGNLVSRKYKLNTPIVRRVLAPGETSVVSRPSSGKSQRQKRKVR